jgi:hypothetical protein
MVAGALYIGAGGGRRRPAGSMASAFTKRKCIPRNTPRVNGPTGPVEGRRQPRKEWVSALEEEEGGRCGRVGQKAKWVSWADKGKENKKGFDF